ncbi:MAG: tetratricopeptide repeat protein [Gammaproteobacteria bacterium]|nr:tetratricopeptide repeat protein [Gammaproteobacteria bacterium]
MPLWRSRPTRWRNRPSACTWTTSSGYARVSTTAGSSRAWTSSQNSFPRDIVERNSMMRLSNPSRPKQPSNAVLSAVVAATLALLLAACAQSPVAPSAPARAPASEASAPGEGAQDQDLQYVIGLMTAGRYEEAIDPIRRQIEAHPERSELYANLGVAYARVHKLDDAENAFKAALERHFEHAELYNQLGIVSREMGRFKDAEQAYLNALRIDPKHANAELNLGILLELYMQEPDRALPHFQAYETMRNDDHEVEKWIKDIERRKQEGEL